jgi:hypothetical protein
MSGKRFITPQLVADRVLLLKRVFLIGGLSSYDLDMDTRLAEETTTLVESYTVR